MVASNKKSGYLKLYGTGELEKRAALLHEQLDDCRLCPRACGVNRLEDQRGVCSTGEQAVVSNYNAHFGEESPLVGVSGSGTIFFTNCSLLCVFCQNFEISHLGEGHVVTSGQLAAIMVSLQKQGCHNINFVTPSHVVPQIVAALPQAIENGLNVPLVYNSSGYDSVETLKLLDGIIDIYMPDFKFWNSESSKRYAKASDYPEKARAAILEMHRQVGDLEIDRMGIARKGLLVRHLVMPGGFHETKAIMDFLAREISMHTYVNVMAQYRPCGKAYDYPPLDRSLTHEEYAEALRYAREAGLVRLDERNMVRLLRHLGVI
ncbi:MAG: radical SAM protein [Proteobacteria bacterium]|nr:radical SAM protein [Pseudomonadota bacterium]MBU1709529.1 radical SAM protein [Pseudomonadota bacterium]